MASKLSPMTAVLLSFFLIGLVGFVMSFVIPIPKPIREMFGAQGGEMVQLAAGHVPTMEDVEEQKEEARQVRKEIVNMTGYW
jgi:hypothetical protein